MAKQPGPFLFEGTMGDVTGYKMNGKYYLKTKSEISGRRIRLDERFSNTRRNAKWFGEAVKLAQTIYYEIDRCDRDQHRVWYPLRNRAQELVRKELPQVEILRMLREEFVKSEMSNVKRETGTLEKQNELRADKLPDEIVPGRLINYGVDLKLIDQLVASTAFVKNILREKVEQTRHKEQRTRQMLRR